MKPHSSGVMSNSVIIFSNAERLSSIPCSRMVIPRSVARRVTIGDCRALIIAVRTPNFCNNLMPCPSSALKVWKQQKNHTLKAKLLLSELSTDLLSDKTIWLQVGRALKSLSKGSQSLLADWVSWTKKSQNNSK